MIHHFDPDIAALLGINQAIVLYNLSYLQTQRALQGGDEYFFEGRWWVRHSYESLAEWHQYLSVPQIKRVMKQLIEAGHVVTRRPEHFNRTTYWSVAPEFLHSTESHDGKYGIVPSESTESYDGKYGIVPSESTESYDVLHDNNIKTLYTRKKRKTAIPKGFGISDGVREWAERNGHRRLNAHLENFIDAALARDYRYVDWDAAFKRAIRDNWANLT